MAAMAEEARDALVHVRAVRHLAVALEREIQRLLTAALRPLEITPAQAEVLTVLAAGKPLSLTALGERLLCEAGNPSRLVERMVRAGLVERRTDARDRRAVRITPTARGAALLPRIAEAEASVRGELAGLLGRAPLEAFNRALWSGLATRPSGKVLRRRNAEGSV